MNWTGGRLQRHKNGGNTVVKRQKEFFAKQRARLQNSSRVSNPPLLSASHPQLTPCRSVLSRRSSVYPNKGKQNNRQRDLQIGITSTARTAIVSKSNPLYSQSLRPQANIVHTRERQSGNLLSSNSLTDASDTSEQLEACRKRLLDQEDWLALRPARPLTVDLASKGRKRRFAKRRKIEGLQQCVEPQPDALPYILCPSHANIRRDRLSNLVRGSSATGFNHLMSGALGGFPVDNVQVRIGTEALATQTEPPEILTDYALVNHRCSNSSDSMLLDDEENCPRDDVPFVAEENVQDAPNESPIVISSDSASSYSTFSGLLDEPMDDGHVRDTSAEVIDPPHGTLRGPDSAKGSNEAEQTKRRTESVQKENGHERGNFAFLSGDTTHGSAFNCNSDTATASSLTHKTFEASSNAQERNEDYRWMDALQLPTKRTSSLASSRYGQEEQSQEHSLGLDFITPVVYDNSRDELETHLPRAATSSLLGKDSLGSMQVQAPEYVKIRVAPSDHSGHSPSTSSAKLNELSKRSPLRQAVPSSSENEWKRFVFGDNQDFELETLLEQRSVARPDECNRATQRWSTAAQVPQSSRFQGSHSGFCIRNEGLTYHQNLLATSTEDLLNPSVSMYNNDPESTSKTPPTPTQKQRTKIPVIERSSTYLSSNQGATRDINSVYHLASSISGG
ncbi:MAG: hypothetical protein M1820_006550 [Bogoriella megaspora]|nr:MAG: hypothetical protein M1820_006550 [Bogoriella megaspora]